LHQQTWCLRSICSIYPNRSWPPTPPPCVTCPRPPPPPSLPRPRPSSSATWLGVSQASSRAQSPSRHSLTVRSAVGACGPGAPGTCGCGRCGAGGGTGDEGSAWSSIGAGREGMGAARGSRRSGETRAPPLSRCSCGWLADTLASSWARSCRCVCMRAGSSICHRVRIVTSRKRQASCFRAPPAGSNISSHTTIYLSQTWRAHERANRRASVTCCVLSGDACATREENRAAHTSS
jgi:hypothetical protein